MRWTHRLRSFFPHGVQSRGARYFSKGFVLLGESSPNEVAAVVRGTEDYSVHISLSAQDVIVDCACPYFSGQGACKHIWATLVAAENAGYLKRIATMWDPMIDDGTVDDLDGFDEDDFDTDFEALPSGAPSTGTATKRAKTTPVPVPRKAPAPKIPEWKQKFLNLRPLESKLAPVFDKEEVRVVYVIEGPDSLASNGLVIHAGVCRRKKDGEWGKPAFQERSIRTNLDFTPEDRRIFALLTGALQTYQGEDRNFSSTLKLTADSHETLLPLLSATNRLFLRSTEDRNNLYPLRWEGGEPWQFCARIVKGAEDYTLTGLLKRSGVELPVTDAELVIPGLAVFRDCISPFNNSNVSQWIYLLRRNPSLRIPAADKEELLAEMARFSTLPQMELPEELRIQEGKLLAAHELRIRAPKDRAYFAEKFCEITFVYSGLKVRHGHLDAAVLDKTEGQYIRRDLAGEARVIQHLSELGMRQVLTWKSSGWGVSDKHLPAMVQKLVAANWLVEAEGALYRHSEKFTIDVVSGVDWFDVHGSADFDGHRIGLPELLRAASRGENMVRLGDGSFGVVPEEWLQRYRRIAGFGKDSESGLRFKRSQAGLLDVLLASQPDVRFDEGFRKVRRELESFSGVDSVDAPPTFHGQLRDYQRDGLGWLKFLRRFGFGGCLADDMGLGKTVQILSYLDSSERAGPALVVVPRSLIFNWKDEAARFAPRLKVLDLTGVARKERWDQINEHDIVLTTYGTLRRDVPDLKDIRFDVIILDEAQAIKNAATESAKATRLLNGSHRLALTGTPIENSLNDLWSLFEFLNPGMLGNASIFKNQIGENAQREVSGLLARALRPFILRRTKSQVAKELPAKTEQTIFCELEKEQRKLYNELRDHYRSALLGHIAKTGLKKAKIQILEALLRLRQAACHPGLIDRKKSGLVSSKLETLIPQLREVTAEKHKSLVFSQFTSFLSILREKLDAEGIAYEYLDGKTVDREACVRRFQEDPECPVFLISLKAGGLGLNLTAAEYVFLLDPWWNPAAEAQAIDRSHRIGQTRQVFAYRLIAKDTVEEKVLQLQNSKRELADSIMNADNSIIAGLDRETLELLLS